MHESKRERVGETSTSRERKREKELFNQWRRRLMNASRLRGITRGSCEKSQIVTYK